ncbi:MAG: riboflavin biosynthesis protein RibF [Thermoleophilia bacterium]|nr:riboflavin biosynthesis protein RibF [Thermoleophilia bacterium]
MNSSNATTDCVLVIGMFDGVHAGHRALLAAAVSIASELDEPLPVHVLTFDPHPRHVIAGEAPNMLLSLDERRDRLEEAGAAFVDFVPFTSEFSEQTPERFFRDVVQSRCSARHVVVGANFRFGKKAAGDVELLRTLASAAGMTVTAATLTTEAGEVVSSSRIRGLVATGDVAAANELLDAPYMLDGTIVHGAKRGRELGYPTANLEHDPARLIPADGVYGGVAHVDGRQFIAAISVGTNPQFDTAGTAPRSVEAYLLDDTIGVDALYDLHMQLEFHTRVRGQATFPDLEALVARIDVDVAVVRERMTLTT